MSRKKLGLQFISARKRKYRQRQRCSFSSVYLYKHTILGTHFQAQTDGLMNVNTQMCMWRHTHIERQRERGRETHSREFLKILSHGCFLNLHSASKLEVLTPTAHETSVKMLILMTGIYSRQCSATYVRSWLWRVKWGKRGEGFPNRRRWWGRKKGPIVFHQEGIDANIGAKAGWTTPENMLAAEGWVVCCQG